MSELKGECRGCIEYKEGSRLCKIGILHEDSKCPCKICLIKTMCEMSCEKLSSHARVYNDGKNR